MGWASDDRVNDNITPGVILSLIGLGDTYLAVELTATSLCYGRASYGDLPLY